MGKAIRRKLAGLVLVLAAIGLGAPNFAETAGSDEYSAFQRSTVGHRIFLLLSDGEREQAIRLCERECRLEALDALDVVHRIERDMQEDAEQRLPYLDVLDSSEEERLEALHAVPDLAISPVFRDPLLERLERLRADSPTDLHVVWAHFQALLVARRYDDALDVARELKLVCDEDPAGVCNPADGSFLEYALYANQAEMAQWLAEDARPHLERAIEAAERLGQDYAVPRAFEAADPVRSGVDLEHHRGRRVPGCATDEQPVPAALEG